MPRVPRSAFRTRCKSQTGFISSRNLSQAVEKCVAAHHDCLRTAVPPPDYEVTGMQSADSEAGLPSTFLPTGRRAERMRAHHALAHGLLSRCF
jgi:hypothetical protein